MSSEITTAYDNGADSSATKNSILALTDDLVVEVRAICLRIKPS